MFHEQVYEKLVDFCYENGVLLDEGHGIIHFNQVFNNAKNAISEHEFLDEIYIAALLHDVDDEKFFKKGDNNALNIMQSCNMKQESIDLVLEMISLVSCSKNGCSDNVDKWKLIPRDCDRLEAIGNIGLLRAVQYNKHINRDLLGDNTLPKTREELLSNLSRERFESYKGNSPSLLDHLYDKVMYIGLPHNLKSNNEYIISKALQRNEEMIQTILNFDNIGLKNLEGYLLNAIKK